MLAAIQLKMLHVACCGLKSKISIKAHVYVYVCALIRDAKHNVNDAAGIYL